MGEAPDDEPDESPRRLTRRRIIVLAVVGSLVVVGVAGGVAVWQLRDPPTLTEQVAAVPGISEEAAARVVKILQSDYDLMQLFLAECEDGTSVRGFGGVAGASWGDPSDPEQRAAGIAAVEIMYKYYCPQAPS